MNSTVKKILSFVFIAASVSLVLVYAFSNPELKDAWGQISKLNLSWLAGLFMCWVAYVFFDALGNWSYLHSQGFKIHLPRMIGASLIGFYYSNITPSAAGGQPMQVNSLRKAGIPVGYGTLMATIRFVMNQTMTCIISLVLLLLSRDFVYNQLGDTMIIVRIGWTINFLAVPLVLLAAFKRKWIQKLGEKLIGLAAKMRLVKKPEPLKEKLTEVLDTYHEAFMALLHKPRQILLQALYSSLSLLGLFSAVVFTYYAFGQTGTEWYQVLALGSLLFVSASYFPLPGASGAQEVGFGHYFRDPVFRGGTNGLAMLVWRFFTYYLFLLVGVITVLNEKLLLHREKRKRERAKARERRDGSADALHEKGVPTLDLEETPGKPDGEEGNGPDSEEAGE